ncbi:MAG: cyclin family protein [Desulfurococcaceae archaeon]
MNSLAGSSSRIIVAKGRTRITARDFPFEEKTRRNIAMYGQRLNLEPKIVADAVEIYDRVRISARFTPRVVALTMLYISLLRNGKPLKPLASVVRLAKLKKVAKYICDTHNVCIRGEAR